MHRVKLLSDPTGHKWPLKRQSFQGSGIARGYHFEESHENYDLLLTFGEQSMTQQIKESKVPRERRFCILMENPRFYFVDQAYLALHKYVISPFEIELPDGVELIQTHPAIPWFYDIDFDTNIGLTHSIVNHNNQRNLEFYCEEINKPRTRLASMITSTKGMSEGHKLRVALAVNLKNYLKNNIDLYGFGHQPIANKRQALEDYRFSIVVENDLSDYFMTEKLCDAILGGTTPIYIGASKVREFYESDINYINPVGKSLEAIINSIILFMNAEHSESNKISQKNETLFRSNFYYHLSSIFIKYL
jgi:hypothetical protein